MRSSVVVVCAVLGSLIAGVTACSRNPAAGVPSEASAGEAGPAAVASVPPAAPLPVTPSNLPYHDEVCRPERHEGFASDFPCAFDSDCVACSCRPVNRAEHARLGGDAYCERFNQPPAREECIATNPACCDGRCVLSR